MDKNKIEDIKASAYIRFCCLLDLFDVSIRELCEVYELETTHEQSSSGYQECSEEDWIIRNMDYFKYHLPKRKTNRIALQKFISSFMVILEDKEFEDKSYVKDFFIKAKAEILEDEEYGIIYDYQKFYAFFSRLIDDLENYIPCDMEVPDIPEHIKNKPQEASLYKAIFIFSKERINFNTQMIYEKYRQEIAIPIISPFDHIPIFNWWSEEIINSLDAVIDTLYLNWNIFERIYADNLSEYFISLLEMKNIKEEQDRLVKNASLISGDKLLKNAKNYAYMLQYIDKRRVSKSVLNHFMYELFDKGLCGAFWYNHSVELEKLKSDKNFSQEIFETLYYYACIHSKK